MLELHTLGVGADYRQRDVRQFAELLTGLGVDRGSGEAVFRPRMAEPGAETVLGRRYGGARRRRRRSTRRSTTWRGTRRPARHIARKLAVHFVADDPDPELVAELERAFADSDGDLTAVYAALLEHPASWGGSGAKVRQPFDYRRRLAARDAARGGAGPAGVRRDRGGEPGRGARADGPADLAGAAAPTAGRRRPRPGSRRPG